jgi:peptide deformylase
MTAMGLEGEPIAVTSDAFPARVWQHEFDHLNGVLIIDHLSPEERQAMRKSMKLKSIVR